MGLCKENECRPRKCNAPCDIGNKLRNPTILKLCGEVCLWIEQGIKNGITPGFCKNTSCPMENVIVKFLDEQKLPKKLKPIKSIF